MAAVFPHAIVGTTLPGVQVGRVDIEYWTRQQAADLTQIVLPHAVARTGMTVIFVATVAVVLARVSARIADTVEPVVTRWVDRRNIRVARRRGDETRLLRLYHLLNDPSGDRYRRSLAVSALTAATAAGPQVCHGRCAWCQHAASSTGSRPRRCAAMRRRWVLRTSQGRRTRRGGRAW
jgi:hypothetical protein